MAACGASTWLASEYPQVRAGLILMMDRTFDERQNAIIVEKAIRYAPRGIVGIDIAGPRPGGGRYPYCDLAPLRRGGARRRARRHHPRRRRGRGASATPRSAKSAEHPVARPDRPRVSSPPATLRLMAALVSRRSCWRSAPLEPARYALWLDEDAKSGRPFRAFVENGVRFTIATDGPEMMRTHLLDRVRASQAGSRRWTRTSYARLNARGQFEASFVRSDGRVCTRPWAHRRAG